VLREAARADDAVDDITFLKAAGKFENNSLLAKMFFNSGINFLFA